MKFFDRLQIAAGQRSKEKLNSFHTTTTDFGRLDVPYWKECVPSEDFTFNMRSFFDAAPLVVQTRGRVFMNIRCFFVPFRILCNKASFDWDLWINNLSSNSHPYVLESDIISRYQSGSSAKLTDDSECKDLRRLISQLSLPSRVFNTSLNGVSYDHPERLVVWPFLAYNYIWWSYYRDSNLIDESQKDNYVFLASSGANSLSSWFRPRYACFGKDYFTTAKVNPQDGHSAVVAGTTGSSSGSYTRSFPNNKFSTVTDSNSGDLKPFSNIGVPIPWLRLANGFERLLERYNIAGGRPMARYLAKFGVAPDAIRLDQPEYIGGNSFIMDIGGITSPLQAGAAGTAVNPFIDSDISMAGQRVGRGVIDGQLFPDDKPLRYHCTEHGIFMVISSLIPDVGYYQGLHKCWQRGVDNQATDYLTPDVDCAGFEAIKAKELALCDLEEDSTNSDLWGFSRLYASYCYKNNVASGDFVLSETRTGMEAFHLLRDFRNSGGVVYTPALNPNFTMLNPAARKQFDRIFQVIGSEGQYDHFQGYHDCYCSAVLPKSPNALPSLEEDFHSNGRKVSIDNGGTRF